MNEDIIRMAREAGFSVGVTDPVIYAAHERFFQLATAYEREACAQIADKYHVPMLDTVADIVAAKIRSRGKQ